VKPECLDWQVLTERTADTEIPPLELVSQSHPPDNGLDVGCDGMVYSIFKKESVAMARNPPQRKHTVPDDPRAISLGTGAAPCNMHHQPEDLFSHWSCLGGSDIPELDDDEDYSLAESEVDDEETLAVEEQLPRDVCSGEELMLLTILGNSPLEEVCRIMNVPTVNTVLNSSDETENEVDAAIVTDLDVASDEVEVDEALPEPSPPISRLTVRFGGTVLEASMQGGRFKEVRERSYAFINRSYTDDRVITAPLPQLPSERAFLLLQNYMDFVEAGCCEDVLRSSIRGFTISSAFEAAATKIAMLKSRMRKSDAAFLMEPKLKMSKELLVRSTVRVYESAERDPQQILDEDRVDLVSHDGQSDTLLLLQPSMRRIQPGPLIPYEDLDYEVWRTRNTYCQLHRLQAALSFLRRDDEDFWIAERRKHTFIFMTERFPRLGDYPYKDREEALKLMMANKDHTIQCIGYEAWKSLFPDPV
jgi:hypothetical protein